MRIDVSQNKLGVVFCLFFFGFQIGTHLLKYSNYLLRFACMCTPNGGAFNGEFHPMGSESVKKNHQEKKRVWFFTRLFQRLFQHTFGTHPEQPLPTGYEGIPFIGG